MTRQEKRKNNPTGLLLVFTGHGKGKTTAALGLACRAVGHGHRVCMIQFIKSNLNCGELACARRLADLFDVHVMGRGFTWKSDNLDKDRAYAREAWKLAVRIMAANRYQLVILDELTYLISYGMISEDEVIDVLGKRPTSQHVVVTGRDASPRLIEAADLVTEMREIKHPYRKGIRAQKGIEY